MSNASATSSGDPLSYGRDLVRPTFARRLKWRLELAAYTVMEAGLRLLPLPVVARIGRWLGACAYRCLPARRRVVTRNLRIAFAGEREPASLAGMAAEVFRRSGANLLSALRTVDMGERSLARAVVLRDEAVFQQALARGKGVVMVLAHMGNWEALAQWFPKLLPAGVSGATVYRPLNNPLLNARVVASRARRGVGLFSKDDNPLGMAGFLRRGGVLGVLSDQRAGKIGELVPFFGRLTSCSPIPAILARRTGAALVGLSLRSLAPGRWELAFHALEEAEPSTAGVMGLVERMMRESPEDVFWMQDRWRVDRSRPHRQMGKAPRGLAPVPTKRRRVLSPRRADGRWTEPPAAQPDDVAVERVERRDHENPEDFLARVDAAAELPLDYVVGAGDTELRVACRRLGIAWVEEAKK